ncbi:hypothetical protein RI367_000899 [Sorochytrium milnesiophthora]
MTIQAHPTSSSASSSSSSSNNNKAADGAAAGWQYKVKTQHPLYTTTANQYGVRAPAEQELAKTRHVVSQKFSSHLGQAGPYRNHSLNTK